VGRWGVRRSEDPQGDSYVSTDGESSTYKHVSGDVNAQANGVYIGDLETEQLRELLVVATDGSDKILALLEDDGSVTTWKYLGAGKWAIDGRSERALPEKESPMARKITTSLEVTHQIVNDDVESIAPIRQFGPDSYDVANSTITAHVNVPSEDTYGLVLAMETEENTSAFVRLASAPDDKSFKDTANFTRVNKADAEGLVPILEKLGVVLEQDPKLRKAQMEREASKYKVAEIKLPAGPQVLRIHASQKLTPAEDNPRQYTFTIYAPQLSLAPSSNVKLGVTVIFPLEFNADVAPPVVEPLPGQPAVNTDAATDSLVGSQKALGWAFHADPKITVSYTYR
jgi:hypothetical protein